MTRTTIIAVAAMLALAGAAAGGQQYDLTWRSIDGGGIMQSTGGSYMLSGTFGQFDADCIAHDSYELAGGFWFATGGGAPCAADLTGPSGSADGNVDALDFLLLISEWGSPCAGACASDITGPSGTPDGNVDSLDFLLLISQWGTPGNCPSP